MPRLLVSICLALVGIVYCSARAQAAKCGPTTGTHAGDLSGSLEFTQTDLDARWTTISQWRFPENCNRSTMFYRPREVL